MSKVSYRVLAADDAPLLCEGIRQVYGATYPIPEFYDPQWIESRISAGVLHSVVALNAQGAVVACMSTVLEEAGDFTADGSALMVASDYRGQGLVGQLGHHSADIYQGLALGGLHLYALSLHDRVQSQSGKAGAVVTGCLPAWFSREARVSGYDYPDVRIGAVPLYMPLGSLPERVSYLPGCYADVLADLYQRLNIPRHLHSADDTPGAHRSIYTEEHRIANRQLRVVVRRCGADLGDLLKGLRETCHAEGYEVMYLDLPLGDPAVGSACRLARASGMYFGALMVERGGGDRLRLQAYPDKVAAPEHMVLGSEQARALCEYVLEDRAGNTTEFLPSIR